MSKNKLLIVYLLFITIGLSYVYPQDLKQTEKELSRTAFYFELLGQGIGLSINADFRYTQSFSFRIGLSHAIFAAGVNSSFYYLKNISGGHNLEVGAGLNFFEVTSLFLGGTEERIIPTLAIGYRYQPKKGGIVFKIDFTPWFYFDKELQYDHRTGEAKEVYKIGVSPLGGISLGYCF